MYSEFGVSIGCGHNGLPNKLKCFNCGIKLFNCPNKSAKFCKQFLFKLKYERKEILVRKCNFNVDITLRYVDGKERGNNVCPTLHSCPGQEFARQIIALVALYQHPPRRNSNPNQE